MKTLAVVKNGEVINIGAWEDTRRDGTPNPRPEGAVEGVFDVVETADGVFVLSNDYAQRRRAEYPSIGDQLDALFWAGAFSKDMAERIAKVKRKYPKTG